MMGRTMDGSEAGRAEELTALKVKAIRAPGFHAVGGVPGLYLQVTEGTGRSWVYRYKLGARRRDMGLGPADAIGLADARRRATEARRMVLDGIDPVETRKAKRNAAKITAAKAMVPSRVVWKWPERVVSGVVRLAAVRRRGQAGRPRLASRPRSASRRPCAS